MKYKLTEETKELHGMKVHRIQALKNFSDVKAGDLGGYIEKVENLEQEGDCWIYSNAAVGSGAKIKDNATIKGNSCIKGHVVIQGNAIAIGYIGIENDTIIGGNERIEEIKDF